MYELIPTQEHKSLFFSMDDEAAKRHGVIGYLRVDFDHSGACFYTTWFDNQLRLKTPSFKSEFDDIINSLRNDAKNPVFANRKNLSVFCATMPGENLGSQGDGYMIRTLNFSYYFRCKPVAGDYDIYCYTYDNRWLLPELAGQHKLPEMCYSTVPSNGELIILKAGESGFYNTNWSTHSPQKNREIANTENAAAGITKAQEQAMLAGSMFGWDVPAAKPWHYDMDGNPRSIPTSKNEPER